MTGGVAEVSIEQYARSAVPSGGLGSLISFAVNLSQGLLRVPFCSSIVF